MKESLIKENYEVESECNDLKLHIVRKSDGETIATLDRFSTEIMEYGTYVDIMETITCAYEKDEFPVLQYFFGWYFN